MAILIPFWLVAQTAAGAQDLEKVSNRLKKVEKDYYQLKKQVQSHQRSVAALDSATAAQGMTLRVSDSALKAATDTVGTFHTRIAAAEEDLSVIYGKLWFRLVGGIVILVAVILLLIYLFILPGKKAAKVREELLEKLKAQRDEREQRIGELTGTIGSLRQDMSGSLSLQEMKIENLASQLASAEERMKAALDEHTRQYDEKIRESAVSVREENLRSLREVTTMITELRNTVDQLGKQVRDLKPKV
jgi:chromosome segregation ATPase